MALYSSGKNTDHEPDGAESEIPMQRLLDEKARLVCRDENLSYASMSPIQRLFLTHYRCSVCKLQPLYLLDITCSRKARCSKCGHKVQFKNSGKYGRLRKKLALLLKKA